MHLSNGDLHFEISSTGARGVILQKGSTHFLYPQEFIDKGDDIVLRGGMHICSPIFGSPEGKGIFSKAPQHGELRNLQWKGNATSQNKSSGICYSYKYIEWGADLLYSVSYFLDNNQLTVYANVANYGAEPTIIELGWHPYFNSPNGGVVKFLNSKNPNIIIDKASGPEIFPASDRIAIELTGIGAVTMELGDGFNKGYVCVWTDWRRKYFCVEPLLSYKKYSKGVTILPNKNFLAKFVMVFED